MARAKPPIRRCAVSPHKSSEEGLEQDFNSLHAQREACEAFIASQQGEGWKLIKAAYDDGGISGGTMERPALQRLLDASGGWPTLPGGTGYPPGPNERFQVIPSSFPRLRLAHPFQSIEITGDFRFRSRQSRNAQI